MDNSSSDASQTSQNLSDDQLNQILAGLQPTERGSANPAPSRQPTPVPSPDFSPVSAEPAPVNPAPAKPSNQMPPSPAFANPAPSVSDFVNSPSHNPSPYSGAAPVATASATSDTAKRPPVPADNSLSGRTPSGPSRDTLDNLKFATITELRPLIDRLNLPADEKFDTLLLMIRSTDDASLVPAAHAAATQIPDDARRAQALLDIIKEIDFFGQNAK